MLEFLSVDFMSWVGVLVFLQEKFSDGLAFCRLRIPDPHDGFLDDGLVAQLVRARA